MAIFMNSDISEGMSRSDAYNEEQALDDRLASLGLTAKLGAISNTTFLNPLKFGGTACTVGSISDLLTAMGFLTKYFFDSSQNKKLKTIKGLDDGIKGIIKLILRGERELGSNDNYLVLVILGSAILEKSLIQLLGDPAREVSNEIINSHLKYNKNYNIKSLEDWRDGKIRGSLGTVGMIFYGLRIGLKQKRELIQSFVNRHFLPEYEECLMDVHMMKTLDYVRHKYRNPACHLNRDSFQKEDYVDLSNKIVGNKNISEWLNNLSKKKKKADEALLHNHLVLRRNI
jgi:hypothetical protein